MDIGEDDLTISNTTTSVTDGTQKISGTTAYREEGQSAVDNDADRNASFDTTTTKTIKKTTAVEKDATTTRNTSVSQKPSTSQHTSTSKHITTTSSVQEGTKPTSAPKVELPAIGYDLDGKGCVKVVDALVSSYTVSITLKNVSAKWMTEETTILECTCYNKNGDVEKKEQILVGALEAGEEKWIHFQIAKDTKKVQITDFITTYWSQWA